MRRRRANLAASSTSASFTAGRRYFAQKRLWCCFSMDFLWILLVFIGFIVHFRMIVLGGVVVTVFVAVLLTFRVLSAAFGSQCQCLGCVLWPEHVRILQPAGALVVNKMAQTPIDDYFCGKSDGDDKSDYYEQVSPVKEDENSDEGTSDREVTYINTGTTKKAVSQTDTINPQRSVGGTGQLRLGADFMSFAAFLQQSGWKPPTLPASIGRK